MERERERDKRGDRKVEVQVTFVWRRCAYLFRKRSASEGGDPAGHVMLICSCEVYGPKIAHFDEGIAVHSIEFPVKPTVLG
jgi:hypothetical protein